MLFPLLLGLTLTSPDVKTGAPIPNAFVWNKDGCHGDNRAPRLAWGTPPPGTTSFAVMVIDPDAPKPGGWVHWRIGLPRKARALGPVLARNTAVGKNDFGTFGWGGPCPPPGQLHHYVFTLYALDTDNHVLATSKLIPVYRR